MSHQARVLSHSDELRAYACSIESAGPSWFSDYRAAIARAVEINVRRVWRSIATVSFSMSSSCCWCGLRASQLNYNGWR